MQDGGFDSWLNKVKENVSSGTVGERGEGWVAAQFALIFLVITGPLFSETLEGVETLLGLPLCLAGIALGGASVLKLGDSISPFPKPTDDNVLTTSGVYGLARHPMYGGLILTCVGLSVLSGSFPRLFFTAILAATLNFKAEQEEIWMGEKHPGYKAYAEDVPRFIPADTEKITTVSKELVEEVKTMLQ